MTRKQHIPGPAIDILQPIEAMGVNEDSGLLWLCEVNALCFLDAVYPCDISDC